MATHRFQSKVAVVGVGYSTLARDSGMAVGALAVQAAKDAILDAGLTKEDIDGVGGIYGTDQPTVWPGYVVQGLELPRVVWSSIAFPSSTNVIVEGAQAVFSGTCKYALVYHAKYRWAGTSAQASNDPLRQSPGGGMDPTLFGPLVRPYGGGGMQASMRRHMHEFGSTPEHYGMIAVNNRTNAATNPRAVSRFPITMTDYLDSRMVQDPFRLLDMDLPIDGAMAMVLTDADRAGDHPHKPVYLEAISNGMGAHNDQGYHAFESNIGFEYAIEELFGRTGYTPEDLDIANLYDGFTTITMQWIEAVYCGLGNGPGFLEDSWIADENRVMFNGHTPMSTHGGNLSEGRLQGFGHASEAVLQLRGERGEGQIPDARLAISTNALAPVASAMIFRGAD